MYRATRLIEQRLKEKNIIFSVKETEKLSCIVYRFSGEGVNYTVLLISEDDDLDMKAIVPQFTTFDEDKKMAVLRECNRLNEKYRYFKFEVRNDNTVCVEYDFPLCMQEKDVQETAIEVLIRFQQVLVKAYPQLMKTVWGNADASQKEEEPQEPKPTPDPKPAKPDKKGNILDFFKKK